MKPEIFDLKVAFHEMTLLFVEALFVDNRDSFVVEFGGDFGYGRGIFFGETGVHGGNRLKRSRACWSLPHAGSLQSGYPGECGHADAEELVEIVGINSRNATRSEQRNIFAFGFLEDAVVEIYPAHVAVYVRYRDCMGNPDIDVMFLYGV